MREAEEREIFQNAVDRRLSGLQENPFLAQRIMNAEKGEIKPMKKKLTLSMVLVLVLLLIAVAALAVALLSPKEIVEQVAVPVAQNNDQENYTYEELADLIRTLNENGITLDEGSTLMKAFQSGHGYWEQSTIREICLAAFGEAEGAWTIEQRHWYGEMMVSIGAYGINVNLIPEEGDMTTEQAHALGAEALKDAFGVELPAESNDEWLIYEMFYIGLDLETGTYPPEKACWSFSYIDRGTGKMAYSVSFDRAGKNLGTSQYDITTSELNADLLNELTNSSESAAIEKYGSVMYFWPDEVKAEVYGDDYMTPSSEEYEKALKIAEDAIREKYGEDALIRLGEYKVGFMHRRIDDRAEGNRFQLDWDFMFSTDTDYLSDGYRVNFVQFLFTDGTEEICELVVGPANMGNG